MLLDRGTLEASDWQHIELQWQKKSASAGSDVNFLGSIPLKSKEGQTHTIVLALGNMWQYS